MFPAVMKASLKFHSLAKRAHDASRESRERQQAKARRLKLLQQEAKLKLHRMHTMKQLAEEAERIKFESKPKIIRFASMVKDSILAIAAQKREKSITGVNQDIVDQRDAFNETNHLRLLLLEQLEKSIDEFTEPTRENIYGKNFSGNSEEASGMHGKQFFHPGQKLRGSVFNPQQAWRGQYKGKSNR